MKKIIAMCILTFATVLLYPKTVKAYTQPIVQKTGIYYPVSLETGKDVIGNVIITDYTFLNYLKEAKHASGKYNNQPFDLDGDGLLSQIEAERVRIISVEGKSEIKNLVGIEAFPKLRELYCSGTGIIELSLTHNTYLQELYCTNTPLTSLDISACPLLRILKLEGCRLCTLDVSNNPKLELFTCNEQTTMGYIQQEGGRYITNLQDYSIGMDLSKVENVTIDGAVGDGINSGYDMETGDVYCSDIVRNISYTYHCGTLSQNPSLNTKMRVNLEIHLGYRQTYETLGGEKIKPQFFEIGTADYAPPEPKRTGYRFLGWYSEASCREETKWQFGNISVGPMTLYAKWAPKAYTVLYEAKGGSLSSTIKTGLNWWSSNLFSEIPVYAGHQLIGWRGAGGREFDIHDISGLTYEMLCGDIDREFVSLSAVWEEKKNYQLKVMANLVNMDMSVFNLYDGDRFSFNDTGFCDFSYEEYISGYCFSGWYMDAGFTKKLTETTTYRELYLSQFAEDLEDNVPTVYAKYIPCVYTIAYDTKGGTVFPKRTNLSWKTDNLLPERKPKRKGYRFLGWKCNGKRVRANTRIMDICPEDETTLKLCTIWKKKYEKIGTEFRRYGYRYRVIKSGKRGNKVKIIAMSRKKLGKKPPKKVFYNGIMFRVKKYNKKVRLTS